MIPQDVKEMFDKIEKMIRGGFGQTEELAHAYIIGYDGKVSLFAGVFDGEDSKNKFSFIIRKEVRNLKAKLVAFTSETWSFNNIEDHQDYLNNIEKYKYTFGNHPKSIEMMYIQIETALGSYISQIPILKDRKLGETMPLTKMEHLGGRMKFFI